MALNKAPLWLQKTLTYQALVVALIGVGLSITDWVAGLSVIIGGAIYSLPAYWALRREFARGDKRHLDCPNYSRCKANSGADVWQ